MNDMYTIEIHLDDKPISLADEIRSLDSKSLKKSKDDEMPMLLSQTAKNVSTKESSKKEKKKKSKKNKSLLSGAFGTDDEDYEEPDSPSRQELDEDDLLDIEKILSERDGDSDKAIIKEQKKNYKKLKKDDNIYKKEFAEELTILYNLLDETGKFGKSLERDLDAIKGSKARGVSKYTNDLAELILTSKNNKLSILKEISSIKKTIADLKIKADAKDKNKNNEGTNNPEYLAAAYFKNVMNQGRSNFVSSFGGGGGASYDRYDETINRIEAMNESPMTNDDYDDYARIMMDRLSADGVNYRSEEGTKYIQYEPLGVQLYVKKCIDTGEWDFIALDKNRQEVPDYPVPTKRDVGRMKFSDDGNYATDSRGRMYNVIEFYLPEDDDDDDDY